MSRAALAVFLVVGSVACGATQSAKDSECPEPALTGSAEGGEAAAEPGVETAPPGEPRLIEPEALEWRDGPPTLPPGPQFAIIQGHPKKKGPLVIRLKIPKGFVIPAHFHDGPERTTILEGTLRMGMGEKVDREAATPLGPGGISILPTGGMAHYGYAETDVIVQIAFEGPLQVTYVNPDEDPRKKSPPPPAGN